MSDVRTLYEGDFLRVCRRDHWEYVERCNARGAVVIVAVTDADQVVLVEQPRLPMSATVLELPAGLVGDIAGAEDEQWSVAAARELEEETGFAAARFEFLTAGPPSPGLSGEVLTFYRAFDLTRVGAGGGDASEDITTHLVPRADIHEWLETRRREGVWVDPKIYTGLYFIERHLQKD